MPSTVQIVDNADLIDVTLSVDTAAYASADVLAAPQEITNFYRRSFGTAALKSVTLYDTDDQNQALDLVFLSADGSIGAENAAFDPADAVALTIIGYVPLVVATHFNDLISSRLAIRSDLNIILKAGDTRSIWIAAVCRSGTPTYTASGIKVKLGIERY